MTTRRWTLEADPSGRTIVRSVIARDPAQMHMLYADTPAAAARALAEHLDGQPVDVRPPAPERPVDGPHVAGVAILDPAPYLARMAAEDLFVRNLPEPDAPRCGAPITTEVALKLLAYRSPVDVVGMTTCHLAPGHGGTARTYPHVGLLVERNPVNDRYPVVVAYQWLAHRQLGQVVVR